MKKGTIDLSEGLHIPAAAGVQANRTIATVQLSSTDISAETAWTLEMTAGDGVWATAVDGSGENVAGTLAANTPKILTFEVDNQLYYRVVFASGSTGNVSYIIMD